jgi:hypothetical protein
MKDITVYPFTDTIFFVVKDDETKSKNIVFVFDITVFVICVYTKQAEKKIDKLFETKAINEVPTEATAPTIGTVSEVFALKALALALDKDKLPL